MDDSNNKGCLIILLIVITVGVIIAIANTNSNNQSNYSSNSYSSSQTTEEFISYPSNGRYNKYFDADWNIVHYKSQASFYRSAYYRDGVPDPDSLAIDYYITGEKQG